MYSIEGGCTFKKKKIIRNFQISQPIIVYFLYILKKRSNFNNIFSIYKKKYYNYLVQIFLLNYY